MKLAVFKDGWMGKPATNRRQMDGKPASGRGWLDADPVSNKENPNQNIANKINKLGGDPASGSGSSMGKLQVTGGDFCKQQKMPGCKRCLRQRMAGWRHYQGKIIISF